MLKFSVVIPAHNESQIVARAVEALQKQTVNRDQFEIIVVDNASTDDTTEVAWRAHADKVVFEGVKGTNIARQRGVNVSNGEIVAFLDADCLPQPDWLELIARLMEQPGVAAVSGPYDYGFPGIKQRMADFYFDFIFRYADRALFIVFRRKSGIMMGGNFATRREYLDRIGGLPPIKFYGDDAAIGIALSRNVGKVVFRRELIVRSSPRRMNREGFLILTLKYAWHFFRIYFFGSPALAQERSSGSAQDPMGIRLPATPRKSSSVSSKISASAR